MRFSFGWVLIAGWLAPVVDADAAVSLRACLLTNNLPYSSRSEAKGVDLETAGAVAKQIGRSLEVTWMPNSADIHEIEDSDFPLTKLARGECDVIFSIPGPSRDIFGDTKGLVFGEAYYGAAFELVGCTGELPTHLRALRGRTVAIQSQTVAHFALLRVQAHPQNYFTIDDAIDGVLSGESDSGLLWGPTAGWRIYEGGHGHCHFSPNYFPPAAVRWNLHAVTREKDAELRSEVDTALLALFTNGRLQEIGRDYGVPVRKPFDSTYSMGALNALQWERE